MSSDESSSEEMASSRKGKRWRKEQRVRAIAECAVTFQVPAADATEERKDIKEERMVDSKSLEPTHVKKRTGEDSETELSYSGKKLRRLLEKSLEFEDNLWDSAETKKRKIKNGRNSREDSENHPESPWKFRWIQRGQ